MSMLQKELIQKQFNEVITFSQGIEEPKTDWLFDAWGKNKERFIKAFGGLIYEYPEKITFELTPEARTKNVDDFILQVYQQNTPLGKFIEHQKYGFLDNITTSSYVGLDGKIIPKGTKLIKAFKHFVSGGLLKDLQSQASRIIQDNCVDGTLCLSVHPLDFLSISENASNWRSCHALDGEYRAGNLSYMADKVTFICYLKSDKEAILPNFPVNLPWNNKKWRVLLYLDEKGKIIFSGKQYPFSSLSGLNAVLGQVLPSVGLCTEKSEFGRHWTSWLDPLPKRYPVDGKEIDLLDKYIIYQEKISPIYDIIKNSYGSRQYNDVIQSTNYEPLYSFEYIDYPFADKIIYSSPSADLPLMVGEYTYCLDCGKELSLNGLDSMRCRDCELTYGTEINGSFSRCAVCGERNFASEMYYVDSDVDVCPDCYDTNCGTCESCGESFFNEDLTYDTESEKYLCNNCLNGGKE